MNISLSKLILLSMFVLVFFTDVNVDDAPKNAICNKVIKTVKRHSQGIALDKLAEVFARRHKQVLLPAELGFPSMETFVDSLSKDLTMEDGVVFHKKNIVLSGTDFTMCNF